MSTSRILWPLTGLFLLLFAVRSTFPLAPPQQGEVAEEAQGEEPTIGIRFKGFLPGSVNPKLEGTFRIEFRIYRSPQGGDPIWREVQDIQTTNGQMDVMLGVVNKIPLELHEATFKFLGASVNGNREVYPRYSIVNVVYVSTNEALMALVERKTHEDSALAEERTTAGEGSYNLPRRTVASKTEQPLTWRQALRSAREAGGDLPDYEDWYAALESATLEAIRERTGHYEWVLPWVYDTASHGRYNRYFRGRFEGCDYMDLSPENAYPYRIAYLKEKPGGNEETKK